MVDAIDNLRRRRNVTSWRHHAVPMNPARNNNTPQGIKAIDPPAPLATEKLPVTQMPTPACGDFYHSTNRIARWREKLLQHRKRATQLTVICTSLFTCICLSGCADLPSSGPTARQIASDARGEGTDLTFSLADLTPEVIEQLPAASVTTSNGFSSLPKAVDSDQIGLGDGLQISVFEVGSSLFSGRSGAASPTPGSPPSAAGEALPLITVESDGTAAIPYVGRIKAAGFTVGALAAEIRKALAGKSQAPEVVVSIRDNVSENVLVLGDVKRPSRIPLTMARETVLDAIALAGGPVNPLQDEQVHLHRGLADVTMALGALQTGSVDDVPLAPQDRVEVIFRPRTFTVFGATGKVSEIPLQSPRVSLAEALARTGGPTDQQADPSAVFVFRYDRVGSDGAPASDAAPIAYRLNLLKAQSYFLAQRFEIKSHDVIYIANAASNQPAKLLQILNLFFQPFYTARVVSR